MNPENPGFLGRETQAGRGFVRYRTRPVVCVFKLCESIPILGSSFKRFRAPALAHDPKAAFPSRLVRVNPITGFSKWIIFGGQPLFLSVARPPPSGGAGLRSLSLRWPHNEAFYAKTINHSPWPWTPGKTCACCKRSRRRSSISTRNLDRFQFCAAADRGHHRRAAREGNSCPDPRQPNHVVRRNSGWPIPGPVEPTWRSRLVLASIGRSRRYRSRNGSRRSVKRGKAPAGQKASRVLRRHKKKWRRAK